jgi:hypothetical protein
MTILKVDAFDIHLKSLSSKSANVLSLFIDREDAKLHDHAETFGARRRTLQAIVTAISYTASYTLFPVDAHAVAEPKECDNGMIVSETSVPGAYQQICMSLPTRSFTLKSTGETITIFQGVAADDDDKSGRNNGNKGLVSGRTGVALWNSGILLTRLWIYWKTRRDKVF